MIIRFGYVAIAKTLDITSSSLLTYTHYKKLGVNRGNTKLRQVIDSNFSDLEQILKYNIRNHIFFYRMTSNLIPLGTHPLVSYDVFNNHNLDFKRIGKIINDNNLRIDIHLDPFCVLNSIHDNVVDATINILKFYQNMFLKMGIDSKMIMHIGSKEGGKKKAIERFIHNFNKLDDTIKKMIVIENDDKTFNIINTLRLCQKLNVPMVLDYHHYLCNHNNEKLLDYIDEIFDTWNNTNLSPKIHFSSPKSKKEKRAHHEYIDCDSFIKFITSIKAKTNILDVMIEAKGKDEAMFRLIRQLKYYGYKFIDETEFIVNNVNIL